MTSFGTRLDLWPHSNVRANDELEQHVGAAGLEAVDVVVGELGEDGVAVAQQIGLVDVNVHLAVPTIRLHQHVRRGCCRENKKREPKLAELYSQLGNQEKPSAAESAVCFGFVCAESTVSESS